METWDASWKGNANQNPGAHSQTRALQLGQLVQSGPHGIKVIKAEARNAFKDQYGTISPSQANHKLLVLEVRFYENSEPFKGKPKEQLHELSVSDARGQTFPMPLTESDEVIFRYILYGANPDEVLKKEGFIYQFFFSVPKNASGFKLQYRDLPQVILGL
jgi:hypothetical protein